MSSTATGPGPAAGPSAEAIPRPLPPPAYATMALVLRAGLLLALALLITGVVLFIAHDPRESLGQLVRFNRFDRYFHLGGFLYGLRTARPGALMALGVAVLIATPMARVLTGAYYFQQNGEREMTIVAAVVLALLLVGALLLGSILAHL